MYEYQMNGFTEYLLCWILVRKLEYKNTIMDKLMTNYEIKFSEHTAIGFLF